MGRTLGWLGRTSYEIDVAYGHGYGLGLPCTDALGPACGHIGTGALFPGYSAGISYSTPSIGGLQLNYGLYDPIVFGTASQDWSHAPLPRQEGAITFDKALGNMGRLKIGVEGAYQPIGRIVTTMDPATMVTSSNETSSVWGVSGGARVEVGPVRLGASAFRGRGIGLGYALQRSVATSDNDSGAAAPAGRTAELQVADVHRHLRPRGGRRPVAGNSRQVTALASWINSTSTRRNPNLSVIHSQTGMSAAVYYHVSDSVVLGLDYFRFMASWYGAPLLDATSLLPTGMKIAGEKQVLDFVNAGVTYHW